MAKPGSDVLVANRHTGPITLPKHYMPNPSGDPSKAQAIIESRTILPQHVERIPKEEWEIRTTQSEALRYYLECGHLQVVKQDRLVDLQTDAVAKLEIPAHLQPDAEGAVTAESSADPGVRVKADIRRATKGTMTVE